MKGDSNVQLNYEHALHLEGKMIRYKNEKGEWVEGKVVKVKEDGLEISELSSSGPNDGYGFGFFGPRPFFRRPIFVPFVAFPVFPFFFF